MYRGEYRIKTRELIIPPPGIMKDFGQFVVIIIDEFEFRKRIKDSLDYERFNCIFGDVDYYSLEDRGIEIKKNMLYLIRDDEIDITEFATTENLLNHYDCFDKYNNFLHLIQLKLMK